MFNSTKQAKKPMIVAIAALGACFGTLVQAESKTYITIENCSNSHHEVRVEVSSTAESGLASDSSGKVHSGEQKQFYCEGTSECNVDLTSGSKSKSKTTNDSPLYVHVKSNHKIELSTSESEVCG